MIDEEAAIAGLMRTLIRETESFRAPNVRTKGDPAPKKIEQLATEIARHYETPPAQRHRDAFSVEWLEKRHQSIRNWTRCFATLNRLLAERRQRFSIGRREGSPGTDEVQPWLTIELFDEDERSRPGASRRDRGVVIGGRHFDVEAIDLSDAGQTSYRAEDLAVLIGEGSPAMPEWAVSRCSEEVVLPTGATNGGALCGLRELTPRLEGDDERPAADIVLYRHDYAHMFRTVVAMNGDPELRELVRVHGVGVVVPYFAAAIGVVLWVRTTDDQLVWAERSDLVAVRKGEADASVVEGVHADKDAENGRVDVMAVCLRACLEELNVRPSASDVNVLAVACDFDWHQVNFFGVVNVPMTYKEVEQARARSPRAKKHETRTIHAVPADPFSAFAALRGAELEATPLWSTGWVSLFYAFVHWTGSDQQVDAEARRAFEAQVRPTR